MLSSARRRPSSSYASNKQHLVGPRGAHVAPAWREQASSASARHAAPERRKLAPEAGSKILVSNLPEDVSETDVWDLFKSMVGPVKTLFIIYQANGRSRGAALVHFHHPESALKARHQYHGKVIDGTNPIRVELVADPPGPREQSSLLARMNDAATSSSAPAPPPPPQQQAGPSQPRSLLCVRPWRVAALVHTLSRSDRLPPVKRQPAQPQQQRQHPAPPPKTGVQGKRKKGPKRVQTVKKTREQLDAEMEEWKSSAPAA